MKTVNDFVELLTIAHDVWVEVFDKNGKLVYSDFEDDQNIDILSNEEIHRVTMSDENKHTFELHLKSYIALEDRFQVGDVWDIMFPPACGDELGGYWYGKIEKVLKPHNLVVITPCYADGSPYAIDGYVTTISTERLKKKVETNE